MNPKLTEINARLYRDILEIEIRTRPVVDAVKPVAGRLEDEAVAGHTPEPWTAQQDCRSYRNQGTFTGNRVDQFGNQNQWAIYANGTRIALVTEAESWLPQAQVDANARLMASAPALLAALKDMVSLHAGQEHMFGLTASGVAKYRACDANARAAIADAKGQL